MEDKENFGSSAIWKNFTETVRAIQDYESMCIREKKLLWDADLKESGTSAHDPSTYLDYINKIYGNDDNPACPVVQNHPLIQSASISEDCDTGRKELTLDTEYGTYIMPLDFIGQVEAYSAAQNLHIHDCSEKTSDLCDDENLPICPIDKFYPEKSRVTGRQLTYEEMAELLKKDREYDSYCDFCQNKKKCKELESKESKESKEKADSAYSKEDLRCAWL